MTYELILNDVSMVANLNDVLMKTEWGLNGRKDSKKNEWCLNETIFRNSCEWCLNEVWMTFEC